MASNPLKASIHSISRDDGGQTKFHALACYPDLREKLATGVPVPEVARWLQDAQKQYLDVTRDSLVRMLYRFKTKIPPSERTAITPRAAQELIDKERERVELKVQPIRELERLFQLQMERITIDTATEKSIGKLFGATSNEMRLAMDMLVKLQAMQQAALGDGGGGAAAGAGIAGPQYALALAGARAAGPGVAKVLANPESRRRVLGVAQTLMSFVGAGADKAVLLQTLLQTHDEATANAVGVMADHGAMPIDVEVPPQDTDEEGNPFPPEGSVAE